MAVFLNTLEGVLAIGGLFLAIWLLQDWHNYTYCCGKFYNKRQFFCAVCNARLAGPCPACDKNQKWKGSGCMHCGHKLGDPISVPALPSSNVRTTPVPPTMPAILYPSSCPNCGVRPVGETFCGNCGENLLSTSDTTVMREQQ